MDCKTKTVAKSKSSNGAVSAKAENGKNKKTLSNAQFQTSLVKKRGVYVEKKVLSSTDTQEATTKQVKPKPPRRPRSCQKTFLDSVLTILSKSTTGTQYPDLHDDSMKKISRLKNTNDSEHKVIQKTSRPKKTKYKSRILKDEMLRCERDQLVILQPRKEIVQTPSNTSFRAKTVSDSVKLTDENKSKRTTIRDILENNIYSGVAEGIAKDLLEAKPTKEKRLRIYDDPETIASEIAEKDDKNMYNFFVDLLETTISVYNVKAEYDVSDVSKTAFELDDTVAEKLDIKNKLDNHNCTSKCERKQIVENDIFDVVQDIPLEIKPSESKALSYYTKPKRKSKSFLSTNSIINRKSKPAPKSKSFDDNKKFIRKPNKKQILNDLKIELSKDINTYNEPESLYDALRVMAKNKRRNEKSTHFYNKINDRNDYVDSECILKRRNVISFGTRKKNICKQKLSSSESRNNKKFEKYFSNKKYIPSNHSLEVYGYDYVEIAKVLDQREEREKRLIFNYHSSPSISESILGDNETLIYNDTSGSNFYVFNR